MVWRIVLSNLSFSSSSSLILRSLVSRACCESLLFWLSSSLSWSTWACKLEVRKLTFAKEPEVGFLAVAAAQQPSAKNHLFVAARS